MKLQTKYPGVSNSGWFGFPFAESLTLEMFIRFRGRIVRE